MHNGFINIDNEKMSKSLNNFFTVRDIAQQFDLEAVRMFMLSAHYRSPVNFSKEMIAQAHASLARLYTARDQLTFLMQSAPDRELTQEEKEFVLRVQKTQERFDQAMDDDLNTADAIGALFELVRDGNVTLNAGSAKAAVKAAYDMLISLTDVLGLLMKKGDGLPDDIAQLVDRRAAARKNKDWKMSDTLRDEIKALGYILEDTPQGQKVRKGV
jgi:cysteinyl-tRNA synthetase